MLYSTGISCSIESNTFLLVLINLAEIDLQLWLRQGRLMDRRIDKLPSMFLVNVFTILNVL